MGDDKLIGIGCQSVVAFRFFLQQPRAFVGVFGHKGFDLVGVVGNALFAQETATVGGDEHVVFDANAAKVLECFDFVEVQEFSIYAFLAPKVDEVGNEVDTRFVGNYVAHFEFAAKA